MLEDAIRLALDHSPRLLASLEMQAAGRGRVVEAYSMALPNLAVSGTYTRLDEAPPVFEITGGDPPFRVGEGARDRYGIGLDITQPLYRGGAIPAAQRAARLYAYLGEEAVRGEVENTIHAVCRAYYGALLAGHLVEVEEMALESATAHLEAADARRSQGLARQYDVLRARVEVSNVEAALIERRHEKQKALSDLLMSMGVSQKSAVVLSSGLNGRDIATPSFEHAVGSAFGKRPDILQAVIEADMYEEAVAEVRSRYFPHLNAFFHYGSELDDGAWDDQWRAGLRLQWTIFDGLARRGAMIQRKADLRRRKIMIRDTEQRVIKEVADALAEIENADAMVRSQEMNIQRAGEMERLIGEGYREGVNTGIELLDARAALTRARGLYYRALYRRAMAHLELRRATGELMESLNGDSDG